jgi:DNA polymerase I-like protein with 3'-5' exonuclease and polymerase domains
MQLEGTYQVYLDVEIDASYLHCQSFIHGTKVSLATLAKISAEDDITYDEAWAQLRDYLITKGWEGTVTPVYTEFTPALVKESYFIVTGEEITFSVRLPEKVMDLISHQTLLHGAWMLALGDDKDFSVLNKLVASRYKNEPVFNCGSPKQMQKLLYEVMGFEVVVANQPTDTMRAAGLRQGTPKTDNLAMAYALQTATPEQTLAINAVIRMKMVVTRRSLYYSPYPHFVHWKTGRVHSSHNQCSTNTRRASASKPNVQQVSKQEKVDGYLPKVREVFIPHRKGAVVVSMDFMAQELRIIADYSQDKGMLACFIGDNKKDMHALTGVGIHNYRADVAMSYEEFYAAVKDETNPAHGVAYIERTLGKKTNFTSEFGAMAPKLAQTLMVTVEEAQVFLDAKESAFPDVVLWKNKVIEQEVKALGYVKTKMGAVRHLVPALTSGDGYKMSKAERQGVNTKVQGSAGEMTKRAEGRIWQARLEQQFDCEIMFPVHDEIVASVMIEDLLKFIPAMHSCMVQPYGDMMVPIMSSISFGRSFGPAFQVDIGELPTEEAILKGLATMYDREKPKQLEVVTA